MRTDQLLVGLQAIPKRGAKLFVSVLIKRRPRRPSRVTWMSGIGETEIHAVVEVALAGTHQDRMQIAIRHIGRVRQRLSQLHVDFVAEVVLVRLDEFVAQPSVSVSFEVTL